ncbi:MAG: hypothetical protein JKY32_15385 [Rhizobiales bacterium]|nr:hypothetical protein [Hyphomicrobiales bacterium]
MQNHKTRLALSLVGVSFILLGGCSRQQFDNIAGGDITKSATNALSVIMGVDIVDDSGPREGQLDPRSPLVLPPGGRLQAPTDKERDTALLTSQWPDDPDERARREAEEQARLDSVRDIKEETRLPGAISTSQPLSLEELSAGAIARDPNYSAAEEVRSRQLASRAMTPEELLERRRGSNQPAQPPGPPVKDAATHGAQIPTAATPANPTERQLVVPPNMQDAPPAGGGIEAQERPSVWRRMQFWRDDS